MLQSNPYCTCELLLNRRPHCNLMECIATISCKCRGVGCQRTKYPELKSIKLNNFFQNASIKPLLHLRASFEPQTPFASLMECIATISCKHRGVGCQRTKYPEFKGIRLNKFFQNASIKPLLHLRASFEPQTPLQA